MTRQWVGQEPPEFPRDVSGLSAFRQRWHSFMAWFTDAVRRLFLHSKAQDARLDALEAAPGGGDVVGPGVSVDRNIAIFDDTTGKLIADSGVAMDDVVTAMSQAAASISRGKVVAHDIGHSFL